jgi:hypothetical protein
MFASLTAGLKKKEQENPLKISFCFQTGDKIVIYVSTRGH